MAEFGATAPTARRAQGPALPFSAEHAAPRVLGVDPYPRPPAPAMGQHPDSARAPSSASWAEGIVHLVWHADGIGPLLRHEPEWKSCLDAMEDEPDSGLELDAPSGDPDRRDVFEVLARGSVVPVGDLSIKLMGAVRHDGKLAVPLVLTRGKLVLIFDELARLQATVGVVAPISRPELPTHHLLERVRAVLETPGLDGTVVGGLTRELRDSIQRDVPSLGDDYVSAHVERILLERRAFQTRVVLGAEHIRAQLVNERSPDQAVPIYLPLPLRDLLPLFRSFDARVLVELFPREDEQDRHPCAARLRALARIVPAQAMR